MLDSHDTTTPTKYPIIARTLSMGGGVQTVACLLRYHRVYDAVIFADTGNEMPETYAYIDEYLQPYCAEHDIPWYTVAFRDRYDSLYDHAINQRVVPIAAKRWCTQDYKIKAIHRQLRAMGATYKTPIMCDIGFSIDEFHRFNPNTKSPKYEIMNYPLLDDHITRSQCKDIITQHGWPLPVKSGCFFCPLQKISAWRRLHKEHPDLYQKAIVLEENSSDFQDKGITLSHKKPLRVLTESDTLDTYQDEEQTCDSGHCFL